MQAILEALTKMRGAGYRAVKPYADAADETLQYYLGPQGYQAARNVASLGEIVSPGADVRDAVQASGETMGAILGGNAKGAALGAAGIGAALGSMIVPGNFGAVDDAVDGARKYYRATRHDSPFNDVDYAMFADTPDRLSPYGDVMWETTSSDAIDVSEIQKDIVRALRRSGEAQRMGVRAADLAREAAPADIVNSAGIWDNPELIELIYEEVLGPKGVSAVKTPDGLIRFSDTADLIRRADPQ